MLKEESTGRVVTDIRIPAYKRRDRQTPTPVGKPRPITPTSSKIAHVPAVRVVLDGVSADKCTKSIQKPRAVRKRPPEDVDVHADVDELDTLFEDALGDLDEFVGGFAID